MAPTYRETAGVRVCSATAHFKDVGALENIVKGLSQVAKVPPAVTAALELAKQGKNLEEAMNTACDGLFNFYTRLENECAKRAGYKNVGEAYSAERNDPGNVASEFEICKMSVIRNWPLHNINYVINYTNEDSLVRMYVEKTKKQVEALAYKYIKRKAKDLVKQSSAVSPTPPRLP